MGTQADDFSNLVTDLDSLMDNALIKANEHAIAINIFVEYIDDSDLWG